MQIISMILAVVSAIPILDRWITAFVVAYDSWKEEINDQNYQAAKAKVRSGDTTGLQSELGKLSDDNEEEPKT